MGETESGPGNLRAGIREALGQLEVVLGDLEEPGSADRMAARLESAREIGGNPARESGERVSQQ